MLAACSNFPDWNYFNGSGLKKSWLRGLDLNQRPSGYEPDELPGCSTPRSMAGIIAISQSARQVISKWTNPVTNPITRQL
jgi:hypothetical protein